MGTEPLKSCFGFVFGIIILLEYDIINLELIILQWAQIAGFQDRAVLIRIYLPFHQM
ncbi:hypothetical protein IW141_003619, partial [Coemansia sp. RSA 355]